MKQKVVEEMQILNWKSISQVADAGPSPLPFALNRVLDIAGAWKVVV